jgi:hypothetical protein
MVIGVTPIPRRLLWVACLLDDANHVLRHGIWLSVLQRVESRAPLILLGVDLVKLRLKLAILFLVRFNLVFEEFLACRQRFRRCCLQVHVRMLFLPRYRASVFTEARLKSATTSSGLVR